MTTTEMSELIESYLASFPERMTGNEVNARMVELMRPLVASERPILVGVLRNFLSLRIAQNQRRPEDAVREARLWLALELATGLSLAELRPDVESLLRDVRKGAAFQPYYEEMLVKYLSALR